jgi:hypothetical protein
MVGIINNAIRAPQKINLELAIEKPASVRLVKLTKMYTYVFIFSYSLLKFKELWFLFLCILKLKYLSASACILTLE